MKVIKKSGTHRFVFIIKTKTSGFVIKICKIHLFEALKSLKDYIILKAKRSSFAPFWSLKIKRALFEGLIENAREFVCFNFFESKTINRGCFYFIFINICSLVNKVATNKSFHKTDDLLMREINKKTSICLPFSFQQHRKFYENFLLICHSTFDVGLKNNQLVIFDGGSEHLLFLLKHYPKELEVFLDFLLNKNLIKFEEV